MSSTLEKRPAVTRWISLRPHHGRVRVEDVLDGPVYVEPSSADDLPAIAERAAGVVVGAAWMRDLPLVRATARLGLPVIVQRGHAATLEEWLAVADSCAAEGNDQVALCESGGQTPAGHLALDLSLLRAAKARSGRPVLAEVSADPSLAGAAVAAGADGLLLSPSAADEEVAQAREAATLFGALARHDTPETLAEARAAVDRVDAALATLLERRAELAGVIQALKPVGGFAGRDMERERQLVARMAERAPRLGVERLAPIMNAVIEAGLHLAEES
ncbi:chorismate mutase [Nonomuraea sp. NPDC003804]|uniref:chorismate mutase n=1 Tax=Nonomuraea sp. NPDC003804 TaxID=3154547 RepID=UPI0033A22E9F